MNDTMTTLCNLRQDDPLSQLFQVFSGIIAEISPIPVRWEIDNPPTPDTRPQKF